MHSPRLIPACIIGVLSVAALTAVTVTVTHGGEPNPAPPTPSAGVVSDETIPAVYVIAADGDSWTATAVTDEQTEPEPSETTPRFATMHDAIDWATAQDSVYGVRVATQ